MKVLQELYTCVSGLGYWVEPGCKACLAHNRPWVVSGIRAAGLEPWVRMGLRLYKGFGLKWVFCCRRFL